MPTVHSSAMPPPHEKLKSTQTSYDLIQEQFNLGMKNTVELLTEKNNLLNAQQETLQAKYMAILNTQLLKFYQGRKNRIIITSIIYIERKRKRLSSLP